MGNGRKNNGQEEFAGDKASLPTAEKEVKKGPLKVVRVTDLALHSRAGGETKNCDIDEGRLHESRI